MPRTTVCPSCGAALRPDAPWCTLCYADLRPKPRPAPEPAGPPPTAPAQAADGVPAPDPLTQPLVDFLPRAGAPEPAAVPAAAGTLWPCTACQALNPLAEELCSVCGKSFLAAIRTGDRPLLVLPLVGDVAALGRGQRIGLALGLVVALLVPLALVTMLLTGKAAPTPGATNPVGTPAASQPATPAPGP